MKMDREQTAFALESELPLVSPTGGFSAIPDLYLSKSLEMCSIFSTYLGSFYNLLDFFNCSISYMGFLF